jgi:hypothetical protein
MTAGGVQWVAAGAGVGSISRGQAVGQDLLTMQQPSQRGVGLLDGVDVGRLAVC